jgi:hypothetical protein
MVLAQVIGTEAVGMERDAAALQPATGMIAETWLDPLALAASTWLDPLSLKPSTPRGSAIIPTQYLSFREAFPSARRPARGNGTPRCVPPPAGESDCWANTSNAVQFHTCRASPKMQPLHKSSRDAPVTRRDSRPAASPACKLAWVASPHVRWLAILISLALLSTGVYAALPADARARLWPCLLFGLERFADALHTTETRTPRETQAFRRICVQPRCEPL